MEVAVINNQAFKIKTKNTVLFINPTKPESDVILLTNKLDNYTEYEGKLVIDGPGEYEVSGVSIKGESVGGNISFDILDENQRLLILSSANLEKSQEAEDYAATVVLANGDTKIDSLSNITSGIVIVVGDVHDGSAKFKKTDKINLKKADEYKGYIVHLTK